MRDSVRHLKVIAVSRCDAILKSIDIIQIKKHEKYPIFLATLTHFFNLGRPEKVRDLNTQKPHPGMSKSPVLRPHLLATDDWVSAFSYVLEPDDFLRLFMAVKDKDPIISSAVYELLIKQLNTPEVYPKKEVKNTGVVNVSVNTDTHSKIILMGFCHGPGERPYAPSYAKQLKKEITKGQKGNPQQLNEVGIFKTSSEFMPQNAQLVPGYAYNKSILDPVTSSFSSIHFNKSDHWIARIQDAQIKVAPLPKLTTRITHGALTSHSTHFNSNITRAPFFHTWGALTQMVVDNDQSLQACSLTELTVNDWLAQTLMSCDLAIQIHEKLVDNPTDTFVVTGASHDYQLRVFLENPAELYLTLCNVFQSVNKESQSKIFSYTSLDTPPKTASALLAWAQSISTETL